MSSFQSSVILYSSFVIAGAIAYCWGVRGEAFVAVQFAALVPICAGLAILAGLLLPPPKLRPCGSPFHDLKFPPTPDGNDDATEEVEPR